MHDYGVKDGDTIFALATGYERSAVAIIRTSGPNALSGLHKLTGKAIALKARCATLRTLRCPDTGRIMDKVLVLYFQGPHSYTGEDIVEYYVHGGHAVTKEFLDVLMRLNGFRLADPGEFTKRAFINGKMDLTEAEAVADLIDAETEMQKMQALDQLDGGLSKMYEDWAARLKRALAYAEATIDFPDEDIPFEEITAQVLPHVCAVSEAIECHLDDARVGERIRNGFRVAIVGAPNAGKSSLVNAMARRDICITSSIAGTTRDLIEVNLDIAGYPAVLIDTAGLRPDQLNTKENEQDLIEEEGIRRAYKAAQNADITILLFDGTQLPDIHQETLDLYNENSLLVINKGDCVSHGITQVVDQDAVVISATAGSGLDSLSFALQRKIEGLVSKKSGPSLTRERHRAALQSCLIYLQAVKSAPETEILAEDIRLANRELGRITGRVDVEDLLDIIFKDFCIGK